MRKALLSALLLASSVWAGHGDDDEKEHQHGSSNATGNSTALGQRGDSTCILQDVVCVSAMLNTENSTVTYQVESMQSASQVGWIGIGFGSGMVGSPMIIMWPNSDGSMTLSQRIATGHIQPRVQENPERVVTPQPELSTLTGDRLRFVFDVPLGDTTEQRHIFAVSSVRPSSSAVDASLVQHQMTGTFTLNYENQIGGPNSDQPGSNTGSSSQPYTRQQALIIAHATLASVGFLVILPMGAILARYLRTFTRTWFNLHWFLQVLVAGPMIIAGVGIGINMSSAHLNDEHKKWGIALFVLYFVQCLLGTIIHYVKPKSAMTPGSPRRPVQNYVHAVIGLLILALSFRQVHSGYTTEWRFAGRGSAPNGIAIAFWIWLGVVAASYVAGLALLRRQFRQERGAVGGQDGGITDPKVEHRGEY